MYLHFLAQISKADVTIAGGKGASLGELTQAGLPVPPGFVILTQAFKEFSKRGWSSEFSAEILSAFDQLGQEFVAVRSSATTEDSLAASCAGILETYLNTTRETLEANIAKCWESAKSPRAQIYCAGQELSVAVVVQAMIASEISGVAFTVHPVTQDRNQMIIEACWGLGELLVGGQCTPDSYVINKQRQVVIEESVAEQEEMLVRGSNGNQTVPVPAEKRAGQKLSVEQILELSQICQRIEHHYGFPCDIEWAYADGQFYILQSRPITTLSTSNEDRQEFRQVMNRTMFLLGAELWDLGERVEFSKMCSGAMSVDPFFVYAPGRGLSIYYNFTDLKQDPVLVADYFQQHDGQLDDLRKKLLEDCDQVRRLTASANPDDFKKLFLAISKVWPAVALSNILGGDELGKRFTLDDRQLSVYRAMRKESDGVLHWGLEALLLMGRALLPEPYRDSIEFLLFDEIITGRLPDFGEIKKRKNGYIYYFGKLQTDENLEAFLQRNKFFIASDKLDVLPCEVHGMTAFGGVVRGSVKIVFERQDIEKVQFGDILVTPMTTPNLISAMNKAAAFVTDEGGVTCHAAIIARELGKPCIIGTKNATQLLKDGDLVEVDANTGVVRILPAS